MSSVLESEHAVIAEARGPTPHEGVPVFQRDTYKRISSFQASEPEHGREPERD
jgi:hypothetical protein